LTTSEIHKQWPHAANAQTKHPIVDYDEDCSNAPAAILTLRKSCSPHIGDAFQKTP